MTTDHVYFPEPNSGRCVANGDEPLCTLSADQHQHQPAAVAPRLSEQDRRLSPEREERIREACYGGPSFDMDLGDLLDELDATRTDLAQARAEVAALRAAVQAELHIDEQEIRSRCSGMPKAKADWYVRESIRGKRLRKALAAFQSEPQPAAPVAPSAEAKVADHVFVRRDCCERCAFWWQVESKRTYCERPYEEHAGSRPATTPPDHQAGDEP